MFSRSSLAHRVQFVVKSESAMEIRVNGESREVPEGFDVPGLLAHLGIRAERVAIERNLEILPRGKWQATRVAPGDSYEIVQLVGGG
jgi:sulfur carrier protein